MFVCGNGVSLISQKQWHNRNSDFKCGTSFLGCVVTFTAPSTFASHSYSSTSCVFSKSTPGTMSLISALGGEGFFFVKIAVRMLVYNVRSREVIGMSLSSCLKVEAVHATHLHCMWLGAEREKGKRKLLLLQLDCGRYCPWQLWLTAHFADLVDTPPHFPRSLLGDSCISQHFKHSVI